MDTGEASLELRCFTLPSAPGSSPGCGALFMLRPSSAQAPAGHAEPAEPHTCPDPSGSRAHEKGSGVPRRLRAYRDGESCVWVDFCCHRGSRASSTPCTRCVCFRVTLRILPPKVPPPAGVDLLGDRCLHVDVRSALLGGSEATKGAAHGDGNGVSLWQQEKAALGIPPTPPDHEEF